MLQGSGSWTSTHTRYISGLRAHMIWLTQWWLPSCKQFFVFKALKQPLLKICTTGGATGNGGSTASDLTRRCTLRRVAGRMHTEGQSTTTTSMSVSVVEYIYLIVWDFSVTIWLSYVSVYPSASGKCAHVVPLLHGVMCSCRIVAVKQNGRIAMSF